MLIATGTLTPQALAGQTAVITGAGGGIGFEAARALAWLGARVIIAEIDERSGLAAANALAQAFGPNAAAFIHTDVGDENSIEHLARETRRLTDRVDIVLNNATVAPLGAVTEVPIGDWDRSYRVNLRGPVLLARAFLPGMLARNAGVFACVSSSGTAFMGAYESFKAAQVHLANTLAAELEDTGVVAFTIGPGLVPTPTAQAGVERLAPHLGLSVDAFYALNAGVVFSVEEAGAGFAAAIALAGKFRGQEILSLQALKAAGIAVAEPVSGADSRLTSEQTEQALVLCRRVRATLADQVEGWKHRNLFERTWVVRDFRKTAGMPVDEWLAALGRLEAGLAQGDCADHRPPLARLAGYYAHLADLAKGYERNAARLEEQVRTVGEWQDEVNELATLLGQTKVEA